MFSQMSIEWDTTLEYFPSHIQALPCWYQTQFEYSSLLMEYGIRVHCVCIESWTKTELKWKHEEGQTCQRFLPFNR